MALDLGGEFRPHGARRSPTLLLLRQRGMKEVPVFSAIRLERRGRPSPLCPPRAPRVNQLCDASAIRRDNNCIRETGSLAAGLAKYNRI